MARLEVSAVRIVDSGEVPRAGARWIAQQLQHSISDRGRATVALSGGHTPESVYEELASLSIHWDRVGVFLATGASKAPQIVRALEGEADPSRYPVHLVRGATWLLDRAAASLLSTAR